jgi:hypothetical protein
VGPLLPRVRTVSSSEMSSSSTALVDTAMGLEVVVSVGRGLLLEGSFASISIDARGDCLVSVLELGGSCNYVHPGGVRWDSHVLHILPKRVGGVDLSCGWVEESGNSTETNPSQQDALSLALNVDDTTWNDK